MDLSLTRTNTAKFVVTILGGQGGKFLKVEVSQCVIKQKFYS